MKVFINDIDVTGDIINANEIEIIEQCGDYGQVIISPDNTIVLSDPLRKYNSRYGSGMFYNYNDYSEFKVRILEGSELLYSGQVQDVICNTGTDIQIVINTVLQQQLQSKFIFASSENANPAEILRELCETRNIPYDSNSINVSSAIYDANAVQCSASVLAPDTSILSFLEALSQIGIARIYTLENRLAMTVFDQSATITPIITLDTSILSSSNPVLGSIDIESINKQPAGGYNVQWVGGEAEYFIDSQFTDNFVQQIGGGSDAMVRINTLQSAVWIGKQYLEYLSRPADIITADIDKSIGRELQLNYPISIIQDDLDISFRLTQVISRNRQTYTIQGRTV